MRKYFIILFIITLFSPLKLWAAELYFESNSSQIQVGDVVVVNLFVNSKGDDINAIEGTLTNSGNLQLKDVRDGGSIVSFWVSKPLVNNEPTHFFSGIIPGGYQGTEGLIITASFEVMHSGQASVNIENLQVLKNDGLGTGTVSLAIPWVSKVVEGLGKPKTVDVIIDNILPEKFTPTVSRSVDLFNNQWFVVFSTQDKNSGIDHYEVCEGDFDCEQASSPYLLKNQKLNKDIIIKAVDKKGNERVAIIVASNISNNYQKIALFVIIMLILVGGFVIYKKYHVKRL
ncbi:MAG TPA: hypothetical protein DIS54_02005 [Candidatus Veblenbacteria bacterium]|nr:hypothetical protein [Candidatus Veblenbacteria bacterium]